MKKTNFTHLIMLTGIVILSNLCLTQLNAQTEWKELTATGSSHVSTTINYGLLTKDKSGNIYAALGTGIFKWNGSSWTELGSNAGALNASSTSGISAIITDNNGNVYAACYFPGRTPAYQVVKWDGSKWSELGSGNTDLNANSTISTLTIDKQGNIYAAGIFTNGTGNAYIAKWNGLFWAELGNDVGTGSLPATYDILSIATDSSGNVYAGGYTIGVEKWNGTQWSAVGSLNQIYANDLVIDNKTNIYVSNENEVFEWSGTTWTQLGTGNNASLSPNALALDAKDSLYESSLETAVQKWNGTAWVPIGNYNDNNIARSLTIDKTGNIYTSATSFFISGELGTEYTYVAKWNGNAWAEAGNINAALNPTSSILTTANDKAGNEYAAGDFIDTAGKAYVAKWNGSAWSELGTGDNALNANGEIDVITTDGSGSIYAAGGFKNGSVRTYVAKWNGTNWSEIGGGTIGALFANGSILSIAVDAKGNAYAAGNFTNTSGKYYVAKWNGTAWAELGSGASALNANAVIYSICLDTKGNVYAAGNFRNANVNNYVAKWNGTTWAQLAGSSDVGFFSNATIYAITSDSSDNIYANDDLETGIGKWNGTAWSKLGSDFANFGFISSIKTDKSGNVYAAGGIYDDSNRVTVQKWNGTSWSELGYGFGSGSNEINSINIDETKGYIYAGGTFENSRGYDYVAYNSTNGILPLSFVSFTIQKQDNTAKLNWQTANEINTSYFNIQRGTDGRSFSNIGKVTAKGSNKVNNDYAYVDDISQSNADRLYYRLQEVDNDGKFNYSGIKIIELNKNSILFTISPNPAKDFINISASGTVANAQVSVTDMNGRMLYTGKQNFVVNQQIKIPTSQFSKQVLIVTINTGNGKQEFKVVKE